MDVQFMAGDKFLSAPLHATEMILTITSSKTDHYNAGSRRNHHRVVQPAGGEPLPCPVAAMDELWKHFPERFPGDQARKPLFRYSDGSHIKREHVVRLLTLAASAVDGELATSVGSHSLRIGGATAMYHQTNDLERVRRFGRWSSGVFHSYLWEGREHSRDLASSMTRDNLRILHKEDTTQEAAARQQQQRSENVTQTAAAAERQVTSSPGSICVEGAGWKDRRRQSLRVT